QEHLALRAWSGNGAVRLLAAYPADHALLLERLASDRDLSMEPIDEACTRVGELLRRLDRPPLPQLDTLSAATAGLLQRLRQPCPAVPRRFLEQARSLARELVTDPGVDERLVHTELHFKNVLAGGSQRPGEWVAVAPRPLAADPAYAVWPVLHNRWAEALAGDVGWEVRCRLGWTCDPAGIEQERARSWAIVRTVHLAVRLADEDPRVDLTAQVTLLKALQPGA
ncbi:MAG: aminoglycoside phosphotransferase family protein, partial [Micrococcales bacterium]|nr:aminoglycoside phosphotransferase family protein [Micrococcales bacterium]